MSTSGIRSSARILRQLYILRYITIGFITLMMLMAIFGLDMDLPVAALLMILSTMAAINLVTRRLINSGRKITAGIIFIQLFIEVQFFSVILYFTGGASNPFIFFYLIPLAVAATVIPGIYAWSLTLITIFMYSLLLRFYQPLTYQMHDHQAMADDSQFSQHIIGMWFGYLVSALLITWVITYLSRELKNREQAINEARRRELCDQQMVALGTLAAGTAHELGTPLASLSIVSGEITQGFDPKRHPELFENQKILREQITRCKDILSVLSESAGELRAEEGFLLPIDEFVDRLTSQWQKHRSQAVFDLESAQCRDGASTLFDKNIIQAIINLLNNAADTSPDPIRIKTGTDQNQLRIEITDNGPGMSDEQIEMAGETSFSDKPHGMGIGLFLAISTIRRCGGSVAFGRVENRGTRTTIDLPLIDSHHD